MTLVQEGDGLEANPTFRHRYLPLKSHLIVNKLRLFHLLMALHTFHRKSHQYHDAQIEIHVYTFQKLLSTHGLLNQLFLGQFHHLEVRQYFYPSTRSEERRVGKECM